MIGDVIGGYKVVERLGIGGFATTYLAVDAHGGQVALKVLHQPDDPVARERFRRELDSTRRMNSQLVARMIDYDLEGKSPWIAFAYIPGRDLTEVLYDAPLSPSRVAHLGLQLVRAVCDLSDQGLVHRDLKPANVRVGANDSVTVVDLGIAWREEMSTLTANGAIGTLEYMAPETMVDADPTSAQDVWAFGLILAKLAGGRHPYGFAMQNTARFISALTNEEPDLSMVPWPWNGLCGACLHLAPHARPSPPELREYVANCQRLLLVDPTLPNLPDSRRDDRLLDIDFRGAPAETRGIGSNDQRILTAEFIHDPPVRDRALSDFALMRAKSWTAREVPNIISRIEDPSIRDAALAALVRVAIGSRFPENIDGIADAIKDAYLRDRMWALIAEAQAVAMRFDDAETSLSQIDDWDRRDWACVRVIEAELRKGHIPVAESILGLIEGSYAKDWACLSLVDLHADRGEISAAEATLERFQDPHLKALGLRKILEARSRGNGPPRH